MQFVLFSWFIKNLFDKKVCSYLAADFQKTTGVIYVSRYTKVIVVLGTGVALLVTFIYRLAYFGKQKNSLL